MLTIKCGGEPKSSFNDDTYDIQENNSFQPLNNYENSFNLSYSLGIHRLRSQFYGRGQKSINLDASFSPLRDFREHCNLERITSIRNLTPKTKYCRNQTLANKASHKFLDIKNPSIVKCLSLAYNKQINNTFGSALCEQDKQLLEGLENSIYENRKSNLLSKPNNFRNLIQKSTELFSQKEIKTKPKVTYIHSFTPFAGFSAFTYKNQNDKVLDKIDIAINKKINNNTVSCLSLGKNNVKQHQLEHISLYTNFFGIFQGILSSNGANYFKKKFRVLLFQKENLITDTVSALFETYKEVNTSFKSSYKNGIIDDVHSCILFTFNEKAYLLTKGHFKCLISLKNGSEVYSLVKKKTSHNLSRREFLQMMGDCPDTPQTKSSNKWQILNTPKQAKKSIKNINNDSPEISEMSMPNETDFLLILNENISNHLTYKECMITIYKTIFECQCKDESYKQMLEMVVSNLCIEAVKNGANGSLSVIFLPQENFKSMYEKGVLVTTQETLQNIMALPSVIYNTIYPELKIYEESDGNHTRNCSSTSDEFELTSGGSWTSMDDTESSSQIKKHKKKGFLCCGLFT